MQRCTAASSRSLHAIKRFSWIGMACIAALFTTGIVDSLNLLVGPRDLIDTGCGRLLSIKVALFALIVAVATINRFNITPRLPQPCAMGALVRNSIIEAVLDLGVTAAVAALGVMELGSHAAYHFETAILESAAFVCLHMADVMADVIIDPAAQGALMPSFAFCAKTAPNSRLWALSLRSTRSTRPYLLCHAPQNGCLTTGGESMLSA